MDFEAIKKAAEGYKPAMVKFLRDMIAIPSESVSGAPFTATELSWM